MVVNMDSKVYLIKASTDDGEKTLSKKARRLFKAGGFASCFKENDFTAVKIHVGEGPNNTFIKAPCLKGLVDELLALKTKAFLTDTSTLYSSGRRHNAVDHALLAEEHGFGIKNLRIPFISPDGLFGTNETSVEINGELNKEVLIASDIVRCQSILSVAHFTGHVVTCAAGTLKTLGMGCASRKGKMRQHVAFKPSIGDDCALCEDCLAHCPVDAITLGDLKAHIDQDKCIGCAECLAACRFGAVKHDWSVESSMMQKSVAEHAMGVLKAKKNRAVFFNYVMSVTEDCDCFSRPDMRRIVDDIGIIASTDALAVDKAAIDLVEKKGGKKFQDLLGNSNISPMHQIAHAERIG